METITFKWKDGLTLAESKAEVRDMLAVERKLKNLGCAGNYKRIWSEESYRRGHTLNDRSDTVRYRVMVEMFTQDGL